jgi:hypothetical protein
MTATFPVRSNGVFFIAGFFPDFYPSFRDAPKAQSRNPEDVGARIRVRASRAPE